MSVIDYLEEVIDDNIKFTQKGDQVHFSCPLCDDRRHRMYVNTETHTVYCQNCNFGGSFVKFLVELEGDTWNKAKEKYQNIVGSVYIPTEVLTELKQNIFRPFVVSPLEKRAIPLPEDYEPLSIVSKNLVCKRAIKSLKRRMVSYKQIKEHKMGYCVDGKYENRIIIPVYENTYLRFWIARAIAKNSYLKEVSPSNEEFQISKSQVIFNLYNAATLYNCVVLSEGIYDALAFGDIGCSLLGKTMSDYQLELLLAYKEHLTKGVYIALDYDARSHALRIAEQLSQYMSVHIVDIPSQYDDPNNYCMKFGQRELLNLVDNSQEYDEFFKIKRLISL